MPVAQGIVRLIVLHEGSVFDTHRVLINGAAHEVVQKGYGDLPRCLLMGQIHHASGLCTRHQCCVKTHAEHRCRAHRNSAGSGVGWLVVLPWHWRADQDVFGSPEGIVLELTSR